MANGSSSDENGESIDRTAVLGRPDISLYPPTQPPIKNQRWTFQLPIHFKDPKHVGKGGQGSVWSARNELTGEIAAIKHIVFTLTGEKVQLNLMRHVREVKLLEALTHPNVIGYHFAYKNTTTLSHFECFSLVMPFVTGTLHDYRKSLVDKIDHDTLRRIAHQLLSAVAYLHANCVYHRDLKPSNVGYAIDAAGLIHIYVLDMGFARYVDETNQAAHRLTNDAATLVYCPLEGIFRLTTGTYDTKRDLWSVGLILAELVHQAPLLYVAGRKINITQLLVNISKLFGPPSRAFADRFVREDANKLINIVNRQDRPKFAEYFADDRLGTSSAANDGNNFRELLKGLLTYEPERRLSAEDTLKTAYITARFPQEIQIVKNLDDSIVQDLDQLETNRPSAEVLREMLFNIVKESEKILPSRAN